MSIQIKLTKQANPDGRLFEVSTIQTYAGGGGNNRGPFFQESDYDATAWPYETMVFKARSTTGLYHEPHATKTEAINAHSRIVKMIAEGLEFPGETVRGDFGVPTMTPERWAELTAALLIPEVS